jgi:hypothetical protein
MTWGIPTDLFLQVHVFISLVGILSGFVVLYGLLAGRPFAGVDGAVSCDNRVDERDGIPVAAVRLRSAARGWRALARPAGCSCCGALCLPSGRSLALDIHQQRDGSVLPQCLRCGYASVPEGLFLAAIGADAIRAPVSHRATRRAAFLAFGVLAASRFHPEVKTGTNER